MAGNNDKLEYLCRSWQGSAREKNKDETHVIKSGDYYLFLIFDGVSSSENARLGIEVLIEFCNKNHETYFRNNEFALRDLMEDMNHCLLESNLQAAETTCCALYISVARFQDIKISHIGDSRIYGIYKDRFICYTKDDNDAVFRNMLTKCMGLKRLQKNDFYESILRDIPQRFLLCTDGFYCVMDDAMDEFKHILRGELTSMDESLDKVIKMRNSDDATFIIVILPVSNS